MELLQDLAQELKITYPKVYQELYAKGMLDWGTASANWYEETFPNLKKNPPLLLFAEDIEIWEPIEYKAGIAEIRNREVYDISEKYDFVPFAKNGAGDLFVFQYDLQNVDDVSVTFLPHDDNEALVLAPNLQDFIFRQLLEALREIDEDSMVYEEEETDLKANLKAQLQTHRPFLKARQIEVLEGLYERDIFEYSFKTPNGSTYVCEGLATYDEVEELLAREIGFTHLNEVFDYTKD